MWPEILERNKQPDCLSAWQVSQLALGLELDDAVAHQESCADCGERVLAEQKESQACAVERVPAVLLARAGTQPWRRHVRLPPVVLASLAGLMALVLLGRFLWIGWHTPAHHALVVASIKREGNTLQEVVPLTQVGPLRVGDKLRLRLEDSRLQWVRLQAQQGGTLWDVYYEGPVPQDRWLPAGFTAMPLARLRLRLLACPKAPANAKNVGCVSEQFEI